MNSPRGEQTLREATAYHEAGHALAALREGRGVKRIYVSATNPEAGVCSHRTAIKNPYDASHNHGSAAAAWSHTFECSCADIRIRLAGPLAEAKILGKPLRANGAQSDLESCIYLAERLARLNSFISNYIKIASVNPDQLLETEKQKVRRWLRRPKVWSAISLVARTLSENGELSGRVLSDVIGMAITPKWQEPMNYVLCPIED